MIWYILFNTLIYGTLALILAFWYSYAKFLNISLGGVMILGVYALIHLIQDQTKSIYHILILIALFVVYIITNNIVIHQFPHLAQRDLFGLIFTLSVSLLIENCIHLLYGSQATSIQLFILNNRAILFTILLIAFFVSYVFYRSYTGKIRQAIENNTHIVQSMGIQVNRYLERLLIGIFPVLMSMWLLIANASSLKATDNLFYLIKSIGIMIVVWTTNKQYIYLGAFLYVCLEYLLFIVWWLPIWYKEALILVLILIVLLTKPQGIFHFRSRAL